MRLRNIALILCLFGLVAQDLSAQKIFERKRPEIFPLNGRYKLSGFFLAPGATYTLTRFAHNEEEVFNINDTVYNATFRPSGGFGIYAEAGYFKVFKYSSIVRYMDVGLSYKQLKGQESFEGLVSSTTDDSLRWALAGEGAFNESWIGFNANFNNVLQLGDRTFLQNTLGFNVDYRVNQTKTYSPEFGLNRQEFPGNLRADIHYRLGFGWKVSHKLIMIPTLETPILTVHEFDNGRSDLKYFSSRYRPIIFSVRFLFLRPAGKGMECVPVKKEKGKKSKVYKPDTYHP